MNRLLIGSIILTTSFVTVFTQTESRVISGGILNGKAISLPKPPYPEEARIADIGGTVAIAVLIDEAGSVITAKKISDGKETPLAELTESQRLRLLLENAAESAAMQAKFSPTRLGGVPVKVSGQIVYNFSLNEPENIEGETLVSGAEGRKRNIPGNPASVSGGLLNGKAITLPLPSYPPAAAAVNVQGTVSIFVIVDENGDVISASAASGHPLLQAAAVEAAKRAKFPPTLLGGNAVKVSGVITYSFVKD